MIRTVIRSALATILAVHLTQYVIGGYHFGHMSSFTLFVVSLTLLYIFMKPLLSLIGMPDEGPGFLFMSTLLTGIMSYVLTLFIPLFSIRSTVISELIIFGIVLPSKSLTVAWSLVFSALLISVLMLFFNWLCESNRR